MPADSSAPAGKDAGDHHDGNLLPVRMLNEFTYCPRLFHLMHVEGRWAENVYTVEGKHVHRQVDALDHVLPDASRAGDVVQAGIAEAERTDAERAGAVGVGDEKRAKGKSKSTDEGDAPPVISRSVPLGSERLGLTAKLDLVSSDGDEAVPVETKRGRVPDNPERSYEPERVQLMAQGLLLREHGYRCDHGVLYFAGSRSRVTVPFTPELEARTLLLIEQARQACSRRDLPEPLDDSPKCKGCSLNGICLPDETLALRRVRADGVDDADALKSLELPQSPETLEARDGVVGTPKTRGSLSRGSLDPAAPAIRRLYPSRDDAAPLYVQDQGAFVGKSGQRLVVKKEGVELSSVRLLDISQLVLCGNIGISAQTIHLLCEAGIPVVHLSMGHWFYGVTHGITLRNAFDRAAQFACTARPERCLEFARQLVADKAANQRTLLRRNAAASRELDAALRDLDDLTARLPKIESLESMLGIEGGMAAHYFGRFGDMLKPRDFDARWDFTHRNRRPPRDPINAMLSFAYALLAKECTVAILGEGLDPWWGFYHQPRHGRPALALDMMEPLRPTVADSVVITAVNTGMVDAGSFERAAAGCMLNDRGRKAMLRAFESRLDLLITHPAFDYRCSWRSTIRLQARLLSRWLRGDVPRFDNIVTR